MSERKLTRATVAMCPECESTDLDHFIPAVLEPMIWKCRECDHVCDDPDYGYYPPDVTAVVEKLRVIRDALEKEGDGATVWSYEIHKLANELEGRHE